MKIIVTTSDKYHHLLPVFFYLYGKYWNEPFELVGYNKPTCTLPDNCTWISLGVQGGKNEFSTDLRKYFDKQPQWFVWMMEDTFIKSTVGSIARYIGDFGRIDLTGDIQHREFSVCGDGAILANPNSRYRLSTQPSIWNKTFLLQYLTPGLSPWDFETQDPKNDGWDVIGFVHPPVSHNEGVRRFDTRKLNLDGMIDEDIEYIKLITEQWSK